MAEARGLPRRLIVPVPVLTPRLSSLWIHLVTPLTAASPDRSPRGSATAWSAATTRAQDSCRSPCFTVREAIDAALDRTGAADVETAWSDAGADARRPRLGRRHGVHRPTRDRDRRLAPRQVDRGRLPRRRRPRLVRRGLALADPRVDGPPRRRTRAAARSPRPGARGLRRCARLLACDRAPSRGGCSSCVPR